MTGVNVAGTIGVHAAGYGKMRLRTLLHTSPLKVVVLCTAAASTVWWQLPLLPGQLVGTRQGLAPLVVADTLAAVAALVALLTWRRERRWPDLRPLGISLPGLLVVGPAAAGALPAPDPLRAAAVTVHLAVLWLLYLALANGVLAPSAVAMALAIGLVVQVPLSIEQGLRQTTWPLHVLLAWPNDFTPMSPGASVLLTDEGVRLLRAYGPFYHPNILASYVDYVVRGHGEITFAALLDAVQRGDAPAALAGLAYRERDSGKIVAGPSAHAAPPFQLRLSLLL
ncbi:MAG: hypothetical protein ACR2JY_00665 [Chloroflexota bacterium]